MTSMPCIKECFRNPFAYQHGITRIPASLCDNVKAFRENIEIGKLKQPDHDSLLVVNKAAAFRRTVEGKGENTD